MKPPSKPPSNKVWSRWLIAAAKLALCALLVWFIYDTFAKNSQRLSEHVWHVEPGWLVLSGVLYLAGMLPAAVFWFAVLRRTHQDVHLGESLRAYYISQLGKYVPGKWMVIVLRRTMLRSPKVETTVVAASVFYETFSMLAVGSALAAIVLAIWHRDQAMLIAAAAGSTVLLGLPTVPSIFEWLIRTLRVGKLNPTAGAKFRLLDSRIIVAGWLGMAGGWIIQGLALWATLAALGAAEGGPLYELSLHTTAVSLGVVVGFLSQIPGGLVTREWVSGELLGPQYGPAMGMISALVFRLVLLVSELAVSTILYVVDWRRPRQSTASIESELSASAKSVEPA